MRLRIHHYCEAFRRAAEGIRTLDLLHGKQLRRSCGSGNLRALARFYGDVATALAFGVPRGPFNELP